MKSNYSLSSLDLEKMKDKVRNSITLPLEWRLEQITKIGLLLKENEDEIISVLNLDLGKSQEEAFFEILLIREEIRLIKRDLKKWIKPISTRMPLYLNPIKAELIYEPLGCILIIGPYNYPFLYTLKPLINVLSAGNTAVIKPSENVKESSKLLNKLIPNYFSQEIITVIEGDKSISEELVKKKFDHIFFTGSTDSGKFISKLASENLTSLTLELGGKNPAIILDNSNLEAISRRLVWGKFLNSGQSCISPNHIFVKSSIKDELIKNIKQNIFSFYGKNLIESESLSNLTQNNFLKISNLLSLAKDKNQIIFGGGIDKNLKKIEPTLIELTTISDSLMDEEIFGPLMPIICFEDLDLLINTINKDAKPLAIYLFGGNEEDHQKIINKTSSGSLCINDTVLPVAIPNLPFGGIGESGIGRFHGEEGFKTFSNKKSVIRSPLWFDLRLRYPPYKNTISLLRKLLNIF